MTRVLIRYQWRYYDEIRERWVTTRYKTEEEIIRKQYPDAIPVEGTREELAVEDNCNALSTGHFYRGFNDK